ncbi:hypothetical protein AOG1_24700 [Geobacter sp. AOG1]|nr:hypothetical protein AOG1_24700 [Geobacter sp. AOG1]
MMAFTNRWQLIVNRLLFRCTEDLYVMNDTRFIVDYAGGDATGTRECIVSDMYRQYLPVIKLTGDITLLDIGANGGGFPLLFKIEGYEFKKIVCVEMNPNTFNRLRYNIFSNFNCTCECINVALTNSVGTIDLLLGAGSTSDSIYQGEQPVNGKKIKYKIPTVTLDTLFEAQFVSVVDILKMDIEGAEYDVLLHKGCDNLSMVRYLVMEIHDNPKIQKGLLIDKINSLGFTELLADSKKYTDVYCFANKLHVNG